MFLTITTRAQRPLTLLNHLLRWSRNLDSSLHAPRPQRYDILPHLTHPFNLSIRVAPAPVPDVTTIRIFEPRHFQPRNPQSSFRVLLVLYHRIGPLAIPPQLARDAAALRIREFRGGRERYLVCEDNVVGEYRVCAITWSKGGEDVGWRDGAWCGKVGEECCVIGNRSSGD
jgi:hypothetical protein